MQVILLLERKIWGSNPGSVKSDISSKLYCPSAKPRRWIPPLVTRFDVTPRVY